MGHQRKRLGRQQLPAQLQPDFPFGRQFRDDSDVEPPVRHNRYVLVVLRRGAEQADAADVNQFDHLGERAVLLDVLLEWIQAHDHDVNRLDLGFLAIREDPGKYLRVQGLNPAAQDLRRTGELRDFPGRDSVFVQQLRGLRRRENLDVQRCASSRARSTTPSLSQTLINARFGFIPSSTPQDSPSAQSA